MNNVEQRSKKYVSFHMFETFNPIFKDNIMVQGLWHEASGEIRYEAILAEDKNGNQISYLFPIFDPESSEFDGYESPI